MNEDIDFTDNVVENLRELVDSKKCTVYKTERPSIKVPVFMYNAEDDSYRMVMSALDMQTRLSSYSKNRLFDKSEKTKENIDQLSHLVAKEIHYDTLEDNVEMNHIFIYKCTIDSSSRIIIRYNTHCIKE